MPTKCWRLPKHSDEADELSEGESVAGAIRAALLTADPTAKVMATRRAAREWRLGRSSFMFDVQMPARPARPELPLLLRPRDMPRRGKGGSERGRIALLHALAHIEFTAIDLALDMAGRFGGSEGPQFVSDWLSVAADEALHFALLERRLQHFGSHYGALPAHDGLWESANLTRHDVLARLAIVPMVLEARGLDVTPIMIERFRIAGDEASARVLERIFIDEIRHVRFGTAHFARVCESRAIPPAETWRALVAAHFTGTIKPPFNDSARLTAGLPREFYGGIAL